MGKQKDDADKSHNKAEFLEVMEKITLLMRDEINKGDLCGTCLTADLIGVLSQSLMQHMGCPPADAKQRAEIIHDIMMGQDIKVVHEGEGRNNGYVH